MAAHFQSDPEAGAGYISFRNGSVRKTLEYEKNDKILVDIDGEGYVIGVEVLSAEPPLSSLTEAREFLKDFPFREKDHQSVINELVAA